MSAQNLPALRFSGKSRGKVRNNVLQSKNNHAVVVAGDASPSIEKNTTSGKKRPATLSEAQGASVEAEGVKTLLEKRANDLPNAEKSRP